MVDSGIKTDPEFITEFQSMTKLKTAQFDYIILKIGKKDGKGKEMVYIEDSPAIGSMAEKYKDQDLEGVSPNWHGLYEKLSAEKGARFAISYIHCKTGDSREFEKLIFIYWCPETAPIKDKMIYSSTKLSFKQKLNTEVKLIEASEPSDIEYKEVSSFWVKR